MGAAPSEPSGDDNSAAEDPDITTGWGWAGDTRMCCSSATGRRARNVAQGVCCGDSGGECVVRNSDEHKRIQTKRSYEHQFLLSATKGNVDDMRDALFQEVDINTSSKEGKTGLHLAVHGGATEAAALLVRLGANVNAVDKEKRTPLHIACLNNHREIGRILVEEGGADTNLKDQGLKVPMHLACINGHTRIVHLLVEHDAEVETESKEILQPIHLAVLGNHCYITTLLLNKKADVNIISGKDSEAPLHYATKFGHVEATELLLKMGASVNVTDAHGITPLHHAAHYDHVAVMKLLLRANADPYQATDDNTTALEMALRVGNFDAAVALHMCYRRDGRDHDFYQLTNDQGPGTKDLLQRQAQEMETDADENTAVASVRSVSPTSKVGAFDLDPQE